MSEVRELLGADSAELELADRYLVVLDVISRLTEAIGIGNWEYALDMSRELRQVLPDFEHTLTAEADPHRFQAPNVDAHLVNQLIVAYGQKCYAGRTMHPVEWLDDGPAKELVLTRHAGDETLAGLGRD